jgi:hypothetical protein
VSGIVTTIFRLLVTILSKFESYLDFQCIRDTDAYTVLFAGENFSKGRASYVLVIGMSVSLTSKYTVSLPGKVTLSLGNSIETGILELS